MGKRASIVNSPSLPLEKSWTPYHLLIFRTAVALTMYYGLFSEGDNCDGYMHVRNAVWMFYVADTVIFATRYTSKITFNDSRDYFCTLGTHLALRILFNLGGVAVLLHLDVAVRMETILLSLVLSNLMDFLFVHGYNDDYERFTRESAETDYMNRSRLLEKEHYNTPAIFSYVFIGIRVAASLFYLMAMMFDEESIIPARHYPMRVLASTLFVADGVCFITEMNCREPQNIEELNDYMKTTKKSYYYRYIMVFAPSLYFSLVSPSSLMSSCGGVYITALLMDLQLLNRQEKHFKSQLKKKYLKQK